MLVPLSDGQSWLDLLHGSCGSSRAQSPFVFVVTWWAGALGGVTTILWDWSIPRPPDNKDLNELIGLGSGDNVRILLYTGIGIIFALTLLPVVRGAAQSGGAVRPGAAQRRQRAAGAGRGAEAGRDAAWAQREAAVSAEATALRRLERDIHDGPQQRLVRLAMDLGRADLQFESDPQAARATSPRPSPRPGRRSTSCGRCRGASHRRSWSTGGCGPR